MTQSITSLIVAVVVGTAALYVAPKKFAQFSNWAQSPDRIRLHILSTLFFGFGLVMAVIEANPLHICLGATMVAVGLSACWQASRKRLQA